MHNYLIIASIALIIQPTCAFVHIKKLAYYASWFNISNTIYEYNEQPRKSGANSFIMIIKMVIKVGDSNIKL